MPWETSTGSTGNNEYTYTGRRKEDDLGLMYYRARYYDPAIGRFISQDALSRGPADPRVSYTNDLYSAIHGSITLYSSFLQPHEFNRYVYVNNNPVGYTDPLGLETLYLRDKKGAKEHGHTALLIGDNKKGYKYLSYGPGKNLFNKNDNLTIRKYKNLNKAKESLSRSEGKSPLNKYDDAMTFKTNRDQEKAAMKAFIKEAQKSYEVTSKNCDNASVSGLIAGDIPIRGRGWISPNAGWEFIKGQSGPDRVEYDWKR